MTFVRVGLHPLGFGELSAGRRSGVFHWGGFLVFFLGRFRVWDQRGDSDPYRVPSTRWGQLITGAIARRNEHETKIGRHSISNLISKARLREGVTVPPSRRRLHTTQRRDWAHTICPQLCMSQDAFRKHIRSPDGEEPS